MQKKVSLSFARVIMSSFSESAKSIYVILSYISDQVQFLVIESGIADP